MSASTRTAAVAPACAPVTGWRRAFSDSLLVSGATLIGHGLGAVTSLLLRMLLEPAYMGVWQGLKLFLSYGNYASLGVSKAAARELTLAQGSGQRENAERDVNLAFTVNTLTSAAYALALLAAAFWVGSQGRDALSHWWAVGLAAVAGLTLLQRYVTYQVTLLRTKQAFAITSRLAVLEAVLTLLFCGAAVWRFGLAGLLAGVATVLIASLLYLRRCDDRRFRWVWDSVAIRRLIGIGGPILLGGIVASLFRSLDKLMLLAYLDDGEFQLGCYSLTLMVTTQLYGLGNMLAGVMLPRYGEMLGKTGDPRRVAQLAARASEPLAAVLALPYGLALAAAPPFLGWILPDYRQDWRRCCGWRPAR